MNGNENWKVMSAFAVVYVVWGSTYFAILIALHSIPPFLMSGSRFLLAGILLHAWCLLNKQPAPTKRSFQKNIIPGILILFGGTSSVAWAEQYIPSSLVAIIVTIVPFWFVLFDKKQWAFYFSNKLIIGGLLLGFAGILLLVGFQHTVPKASVSVTTGQQIAGILVVIAGGISWATGSLYSKYNPASDSLLMNASLQLLIAGVFTLLVSVVSGEAARFSFNKVSAGEWGALLYLAIISSIITYLCYLYLLKMRPAAQVSTYVYVNPVIALFLGAMFVNEKITGLQVLALAVILSGVLLVNLPKYKGLLFTKTAR